MATGIIPPAREAHYVPVDNGAFVESEDKIEIIILGNHLK